MHALRVVQDVFQIAARRLGLDPQPERVLVFEDGLPGVEAARRAGMPCVWVPDPELRAHRAATSETSEVDLSSAEILDSLLAFRPEAWGLPAYDAPVL